MNQPTVLPWHRDAAKEFIPFPEAEDQIRRAARDELATIIARHDPHAETLRLLERAQSALVRCGPYDQKTLAAEIRAHLAAHSKPDGKKGSK